jgi:PST family polysaccharide transporter
VGLPNTRDLTIAAVLFFAAIPLLGLQTNLLALLQGLLDVRGLAIQRSVAVLIATALCVPLVWVWGLIGAAATFVALNALLTLMFGLRCRALGYDWLAFRLNRIAIGTLATFGIASMIAGFGQTIADTAIRTALLVQFGSDANGLLQAPLVLASTLHAVVLGSIGSISLASLSRAANTEETRRTIDRLLNVALPLSTAALGLLGLLSVPAIVVLYSEEFVASATLLPWILGAYLVQVVAWVVGAPLLASGDRAVWLALELGWSAARWAISVALLPQYGAAAVGMGMLFAMILHVAANLLALRLRYQVRISLGHGIRLVTGMALLGFVTVIGANWTTSAPAMLAAAVVWLAYAAYVVRSSPVMAPLRSRWSSR